VEDRLHPASLSAGLRVGVIGPGRSNDGTGPYVARFLAEAGAEVTAVAASSEPSSRAAAAALEAHGIQAAVYPDAAHLVRHVRLDAVAICSPTAHHEEHLELALAAGLHVFCEKPLVWRGGRPCAAVVASLVDRFGARGRALFCNTQWIHTLDGFAELHGRERLRRPRSFRMELSPPRPGWSMYEAAAPHPIGMLVALGAGGTARAVRAAWSEGRDALEVELLADVPGGDAIAATWSFRAQAQQPRPAAYAIDGARVEREVDLSDYRISLHDGERRVVIPDPLKRSVETFLSGLTGFRAGEQAAILRSSATLLDAVWRAVASAP
jgi:hypothetical protein